MWDTEQKADNTRESVALFKALQPIATLSPARVIYPEIKSAG